MDVQTFKCAGVIIKPHDDRGVLYAKKLIPYLLQHFERIVIDTAIDVGAPMPQVTFMEREELVNTCDLAISLGGDGTLLSAARLVVEKQVPLVGINLGNLGFLVEISPHNMEQELKKIFSGSYRIEQRVMLHVTHMRNDEMLESHNVCNDVVIKHRESVRMIELSTTVDGAFLNTVRADGLIVATPTGSTAYALASGGPLVEPTLEATLVVPICPHTLSYRPLIIGSCKTIEIVHSLHNEDEAMLSIDAQIDAVLNPGDYVIIKALPNKLQLIQPKEHDYFHTLRSKLRWSEKL